MSLATDGLPPLREVVAEYGLQPKKALGQNFLFDLNLTGRIARAAGVGPEDTIVEIGPGPGGLTRALLAAGAGQVIAVERDARCLAALEQVAQHWPGHLRVIEGDALSVDLSSEATGAKIVANLPYNVGTELLLRWLTVDPWPPWWTSLTLMFQREVAERIVAAPGSKSYGRLSVLAAWRCRARILFDIPPQAFTPPPKVTSSVVHLTPWDVPINVPLAALESVTAAAFGQRRKMLRRSLSSIGGEALLERADITPTLRAEELDIEEFCRLARELKRE